MYFGKMNPTTNLKLYTFEIFKQYLTLDFPDIHSQCTDNVTLLRMAMPDHAIATNVEEGFYFFFKCEELYALVPPVDVITCDTKANKWMKIDGICECKQKQPETILLIKYNLSNQS